MDCIIYVAKTKTLISFAVSASLFFAYAKRWFSHHAAYIWAGCHLGHVTRMPRTNFRSLYTRRLHIKFYFNLPSSFNVEDVWNC